VSEKGIQEAQALWEAKEREAIEGGFWAGYTFCGGCGHFRCAAKHTDAQLSGHVGGDLGALVYYDRQRVMCNSILGRCQGCFDTFSRAGCYPRTLLHGNEAEKLRDWINSGGLMGMT
jgi:hypothetical protein